MDRQGVHRVNEGLPNRQLRSAAQLSKYRDHGDRLRYMGGCRCDLCRKANSAYESMRKRARKAGDFNGIVPAAKARSHMLKLRRQSVGRRAIAAATDIADTILSDILSGRKKKIRARTERKILAVDPAMASDRAIISSAKTLELIADLIDEGYTQAFLCERMGYANKYFQFNERITVRNAWRVEKLHRELTT
jgi:hypothetical protein